ncbi:MAG: hypothetical protein GQ559_05650 [Desulfobulbaceae bacterium]|nr:hypothetical protein [Desulfobulbaceae bacterium]
MVKGVKIQRRRKRRLYFIGLLLVLSAAVTGILNRFPLSLQDIGRTLQLVAGKIFSESADTASAETVLRGTVYDRNLKELAVSYRLYSLYVHPSEVRNRDKVAEALSAIVGEEKESLEARLKTSHGIVEFADDLDEDQARIIKNLNFEGVYCKAGEERFYPSHTTAAHLLGFVSDRVGLAGVEGKYDMVLQPGEFKDTDIAEIAAADQQIFGRTTTDLILTIDLGLQLKLEKQLRQYLKNQSAGRGTALLVEPATGKLLAMASQPAFNPNYFWQAGEKAHRNELYENRLDVDLIRSLLVRAAAVEKFAATGQTLLPETIASPDFGLKNEEIVDFQARIGMQRVLNSALPSWTLSVAGEDCDLPALDMPAVSSVQMEATLASLINGGWRIHPYFLDSMYDRSISRKFMRNKDTVVRDHVLSPATGVRVRRELLLSGKKKEDFFVFTGMRNRVMRDEYPSRYTMQQMLFGLIPRKMPKLLLLMTVEYDSLYPLTKQADTGQGALAAIGRDLLPGLYAEARQEVVAELQPGKSQDNFRQFLISRRVDFQERPQVPMEIVQFMPEMQGLSLRKGLQRINQYRLNVMVEGSGRIVAQQPAPGASLNGVRECVLTLDPKI